MCMGTARKHGNSIDSEAKWVYVSFCTKKKREERDFRF